MRSFVFFVFASATILFSGCAAHNQADFVNDGKHPDETEWGFANWSCERQVKNDPNIRMDCCVETLMYALGYRYADGSGKKCEQYYMYKNY